MATFGGITCNFVHGHAPSLVAKVEAYERPGIDGTGSLALGDRGDVVQFRLVYFGSYANCLAWVHNIEALIGTPVTVINDWGTTFTNFLAEAMIGPPVITRLDTATTTARAEIRIRGRTVA